MTSPFPFIVGAPRSGTTLLRLMLDAHPALAIPPETGFLHLARELGWNSELRADEFVEQLSNFPRDSPTWPDFALSTRALRAVLPERVNVVSGLLAFYRVYAERFDKPLAGDKTPGHSECMSEAAQHWPGAHFIHLVRDGRDVALSWRPLWFSPSKDLGVLAATWAGIVQRARVQGRQLEHYLEVRYEALVAQPEAELRRICSFLDLAFDGRMLEHEAGGRDRLAEHQGRYRPDGSALISREDRLAQQRRVLQKVGVDRIGVWRAVMKPDELRACMIGASSALVELGYETQESALRQAELGVP